jgi:hypothetical protein
LYAKQTHQQANAERYPGDDTERCERATWALRAKPVRQAHQSSSFGQKRQAQQTHQRANAKGYTGDNADRDNAGAAGNVRRKAEQPRTEQERLRTNEKATDARTTTT